MKKFGQRLILLIAAVTVFFTGAGVTIVNYCCSSCSGQTLFMTEQHTCCAQSESNDDAELDGCCEKDDIAHSDACQDGKYTNDSHCKASRLSVDIDASSFRPHITSPFSWISDAALVLSTVSSLISFDSTDKYVHSKSPPDIPPREYLSLLRVLII